MFLTSTSFLTRVKELNSDYWNEGKSYRWEYMVVAIRMLEEIGAENIIEAGSSGIPLCNNSFLFDYPVYDLDKIPYKIKFSPDMVGTIPDKTFDAFCALQTWEHLKNPVDAFAEVKRISRAAILSVPYKWKHGDAQHQNIDMNRILEWTSGLAPDKTVIVRDRIVCLWRFA
jgi:hypothetical protein